jgi:hypothetical protein
MVSASVLFSATQAASEADPRSHHSEPFRFTVEQYRSLIQTGVIPESPSHELLDGLIVIKDRRDSFKEPLLAHGKRHAAAMMRLSFILGRSIADGHFAQFQLPLICGPSHAPEPDAAILKGTPNDYTDRLPTAADAVALFEVSDSSLDHDTTTKLAVYAEAAIPHYIVVNLRDMTLDHYSSPAKGSYSHLTRLQISDTLHLAIGSTTLKLQATTILPT